MIKMFNSISDIRIFIAPGNHDPINEEEKVYKQIDERLKEISDCEELLAEFNGSVNNPNNASASKQLYLRKKELECNLKLIYEKLDVNSYHEFLEGVKNFKTKKNSGEIKALKIDEKERFIKEYDEIELIKKLKKIMNFIVDFEPL